MVANTASKWLFLDLSASIEGSVRLVNGTNYNSQAGCIEIYSSGAWYSVCADYDLCTDAGKVICRQLGYSDVGMFYWHMYSIYIIL